MTRVDRPGEHPIEIKERSEKTITYHTALHLLVKCFDPHYEWYSEVKSFWQSKDKVPVWRIKRLLKVYCGHHAWLSRNFVNSMTSAIVRTASKMVRPFRKALWSWWIIWGEIFSDLWAMVFELIFASTLTREICLQFLINLPFLFFFSAKSFFSITVDCCCCCCCHYAYLSFNFSFIILTRCFTDHLHADVACLNQLVGRMTSVLMLSGGALWWYKELDWPIKN